MNRDQEIEIIERHISECGVYRCRMGESYYGDEGIGLRTATRNRLKAKKPPRVQVCQLCKESFACRPAQKRKYCSSECASKAQSLQITKGKSVPCAACGSIHHRMPKRIWEPERMFCSLSCAATAQNAKRKLVNPGEGA